MTGIFPGSLIERPSRYLSVSSYDPEFMGLPQFQPQFFDDDGCSIIFVV
jgi:hypothetical protein